MRISTTEFLLGALPELLTQQSNLNQLNQEIATGQTMLDASSDPAGAGLAMQTGSQIRRLMYDMSNAQAGSQSLQTAVGALEQVNSLIDQLSQIALTAANGATTSDTRQSLAAQAQTILQQLIGLANTQDVNGNYVFAGSQVGSAPFTVGADGQVSFSGDSQSNTVEVAPGISVPVTASGQGIFVTIPAGGNGVGIAAATGNTGTATAVVQGVTSLSQLTAEQLAGTEYQVTFAAGPNDGSLTYTIVSGTGDPGSPQFGASSGVVASGAFTAGSDLQFGGVDIAIQGTPASGDSFTVQPGATSGLFQTVQDLIAALGPQTGEVSSSTQQQIENAIANLAAAQTSVLTAEAGLGAGMSEIQALQNQDQTQSLGAQAQLSTLQSANLPAVIANYSASVTALQAAEESIGMIKNLTLFNYIHS